MKLKKQLKLAKRMNANLVNELEFCSKARDVERQAIRETVLKLRDKRVELNTREKELAATLQTVAAISKRIDFNE